MSKKPKTQPMVGRAFGLLTVTEVLPSSGGRSGWVRAVCACGATVERPGGNLRSGAVRSCGCLPAILNIRHIERTASETHTYGELRLLGAAFLLEGPLAHKACALAQCLQCGWLEAMPTSALTKMHGRTRCAHWRLHDAK